MTAFLSFIAFAGDDILKEMAEQRVMLRSVLESIQNLHQSVSSLVRSSKRSSNADVAELPEDVTFPLKTVDDVCNLNERLVDNSLKATLVSDEKYSYIHI